jgi:hypothetical protein
MKRKSARLKVTKMPDFFLSLERAISRIAKAKDMAAPTLSVTERSTDWTADRRQILFHGAKSEGPMPVRDCKEGATPRAETLSSCGLDKPSTRNSGYCAEDQPQPRAPVAPSAS